MTLQGSLEQFDGCILEVTFSSTFMPKNVSEMTGHNDLVDKDPSVLPWHQKSLPHLQKAFSSGNTLSKLSAESFIKFIFFLLLPEV